MLCSAMDMTNVVYWSFCSFVRYLSKVSTLRTPYYRSDWSVLMVFYIVLVSRYFYPVNSKSQTIELYYIYDFTVSVAPILTP